MCTSIQHSQQHLPCLPKQLGDHSIICEISVPQTPLVLSSTNPGLNLKFTVRGPSPSLHQEYGIHYHK